MNIPIPLLTVLLLASPAIVLSDEFKAIDPKFNKPAVSATVDDGTADLVISAVGDIMLDGTARPVMAEQGYDYPFVKCCVFQRRANHLWQCGRPAHEPGHTRAG